MSTVPSLFYADRSERGRLRLTGRDRQSFLQGMVSNDVGSLQPGQGVYTFLLDATGHVIADARVLCTPEYLLLDVEPGMVPTVTQQLERHLVMERVRITDISGEMGQLLVAGNDTPTFLAKLTTELSPNATEGANAFVPTNRDGEGYIVAAARLLPVPAFDVYGSTDALANFRARLEEANAASASPELLDTLRIEAGVPRFGSDMDARVLAPETSQQKRAIHYRKGCYIGQEIVARIDARGHTNRTLVGFVLPANAPIPPAEVPVVVDGGTVGRVTSAALSPHLARPIALGYLRHEYANPGTPVKIGDDTATVVTLPFDLSGQAG